jgi:hypothetical protein
MIYAKASKQIILIVIFCLIAVTFVGYFPWSAMNEKELDKSGSEKSVTRFYTYNDYQEIDFFDEMEQVADTLIVVYAMQWMMLLFAMFALLGLVMVRMDYFTKIGQVMIFVGTLAFIFALIGLLTCAVAAYQMGQAQEEIQKLSKDTTLVFAYNYIPMIMDILVLMLGLLLLMTTSLPLLRVILEPVPMQPGAYYPPQGGAYPPPQYPPPQYPPPQPQAPPPAPGPAPMTYEPPPPPPPQPAPAMAMAQAAPATYAPPAPPPPSLSSAGQASVELEPDGTVIAEPTATPKEAESQICLHCLNSVPTGTKFCAKCGTKVI